MLRQIVILLIIYLLTSVQYSKAANQDYILSIDEPTDDTEGFIAIKKKSTQGNGMSVCSWIKQESDYFHFIYVYDNKTWTKHFQAYTDIFDAWILAFDGYNPDTIVEDCNFGNLTSWYHVCVTKNRTSFYFYLNGRPVENYVYEENATVFTKSDNLLVTIGGGNGDIGSLYQINVYDRVLTVEDAKNIYNCKFMDGDIVSWKDITSKSNDITFGNKIQLIQAPVPCPTPPYKPINCSTGEPLEEPNNIAAGEPGSSSPSGDSGSSSPSGDSGSSSPSGDSGSSSPSRDSGSSSTSGDSGSSSPTRDSGSNSPSGDSGSSSPSRDSGSSSPYGDPGSSSTSGDSGSSSPNAGPATSSED